MRNLKKMSLLTAIFSLMLISSLSLGKASAQQQGTCSRVTEGGLVALEWRCSLPGLEGKIFTTEAACNSACTLPAPPPICVNIGGLFSGPAGTFECCSGLTKCSSTGKCETSCAASVPSQENEFCFKTSDCLPGLTCAIADPDLGFGGTTCQRSPPPPAPIPSNSCKEDSDCQSGFACVRKCFDPDLGEEGCQKACRKKETAPPTVTCESLNCSPNKTCIESSSGPTCLTKGIGATGSFCGKPDKSPNNQACGSDFCDPTTLLCSSKLTWKEIEVCSAPPAAPGGGQAPLTEAEKACFLCGSTKADFEFFIKNKPKQRSECNFGCGATDDKQSACFSGDVCAPQPPAAPPPDVVPPAGQQSPQGFACRTNFHRFFGGCSGGISGTTTSASPTDITKECDPSTLLAISCRSGNIPPPAPPGVPAPAAPGGQTTTGPTVAPPSSSGFSCQPQIFGGVMTTFTCRNNIIGSTEAQCIPGEIPFNQGGATTCGPQATCCKKITAAATPAPGSAQATTTLAVTLNAQDTVLASDTLPVALSLFNLSTNTLVQGAPATSVFNKTPIPGKQFAANIPISGLLQNKFFLLIRKDNLIARTFFTIDSSGSITVPTTTLVFGDINADNDINILDFNILIGCFGKPAASTGCSASDFDSSGKIGAIDFNTWIRGLATWRKQI